MNVTEQIIQRIRDEYYWIDNTTVFHKDTVHMLILIIAIMIFVCIVVWYSREKDNE